MRSSATNSGLPVRTARATASDGRLDTLSVPVPRFSCSSAKYVAERNSVMTTRSRLAPSASTMSRNRSWVMGRGVATPWMANAMAVASGAPMKIGSVRPRPSASVSSSTGVFDCRSTLTALSRTSTMLETYRP